MPEVQPPKGLLKIMGQSDPTYSILAVQAVKENQKVFVLF